MNYAGIIAIFDRVIFPFYTKKVRKTISCHNGETKPEP